MSPTLTPHSQDSNEIIAYLRTTEAIRQRCNALLELGLANQLNHFAVDLRRISAAAEWVATVTRQNYPNLAIPYHSRWRHFAVGGIDRWDEFYRSQLLGLTRDEIARIQGEIAITSVLLDAGAGSRWQYRDCDQQLYSRSEGLAVASLRLYQQGGFSSDHHRPWRVDATALSAFDRAHLAKAFQVDGTNPLVGLEGRAALLRRLGKALAAQPHVFGDPPRLGNLLDHLVDCSGTPQTSLPAAAILEALLLHLGTIWPGHTLVNGINLGDVWRHRALGSEETHSDLVPFHKLSQWLSYSLVEPLEAAGVAVTELESLTGLPEYRNGGLLLDMGVLQPRYPELLTNTFEVGDEAIVEWRALTVALLDSLSEAVRDILGMDSDALPLAKILQGGTWSAGRLLAQRRREGASPIVLNSDGTVF
ncbi:MAG: URC4/urg3 family protein [Candidatus Competibacterales bacterium]